MDWGADKQQGLCPSGLQAGSPQSICQCCTFWKGTLSLVHIWQLFPGSSCVEGPAISLASLRKALSPFMGHSHDLKIPHSCSPNSDLLGDEDFNIYIWRNTNLYHSTALEPLQKRPCCYHLDLSPVQRIHALTSRLDRNKYV